ncbi:MULTISPECIES: M20/M25/M40 family metallo-hydrolase [unclassified Paenibacillus]|uniref:M20/M25/M40 family metallo-hydrolase n=1 Tax=unclassified Paenibacillus TaxID=185978 RepID=UPI001AE767DE|nr:MULTISPECIES: M20/M25/M40 family metallo-hydrolase [unclassified Paenibacillus]MBP1154459.1 acetylornithine deacetylase/succinyl-diaminopimelate desuccinylase-like protein [Paenibacillus sp. PvP091]MBP1170157.1 acetylornithine deacetylase/succinyl-diaminopimelate desuccinylase-like protein [Paenibacillus sp. PvR098]MBP2441185.1 acetylornithine deacetylase/succinyl-diaminopimelate desuccinylase-like protein [Paenibacillus sp. PvP052]
MTDKQTLELIWNQIDENELIELILDLGKIYSPTTHEREVADYVLQWLVKEGITAKEVSLIPERPNILAKIKGSGDGKSLIFNSHMDTAIWHNDPRYREPNDPIYHSAWRDGDWLYGNGVMNDKGQLGTWLIAVKALRKAGVQLKGDLLLSMVSGEIGYEPVDEFQGLDYSGKDMGARYLVTHGGVADYALVAEASNFTIGWVEAGKAFCKVTVYGGKSLYTPYVPRRTRIEESPNAIVQGARFIQALESWANIYEDKYRYECAGGTVIPKISIGGIRGGLPYQVTKTTEVCHIYIDVRMPPGTRPTDIVRELETLLQQSNLEGQVELILYRPGHEAQGTEPLVEAIREAHQSLFGELPGKPPIPTTSMWRDINPFNEVGIPAVFYGPGGGSGGGGNAVLIQDFVNAAKVYAATILNICNQER